MGSTDQNLNILFFPYFAQSHMLPMIDVAKLFASRGVAVTILTTAGNSALIRPTIDRFNSSTTCPIRLHLIPFPYAEVGLPEGCDNLSSLPSETHLPNFIEGVSLLRNPFDRVLKQLHFDCVVTDVFLPWTYEVAAENGVPRILFGGTNFFAGCAIDSIERHKLPASLPPAAESFALPGLPHRIEILRSQLEDRSKFPPFLASANEAVQHAKEVDSKNYGVVVNSFYELEPDYADHYRKVLGKKAWHVGPAALCNREEICKLGFECLKWLDGRKPGSIVYMCFGTLSLFTAAQLTEMALGLEASGHPFVWVIRSAGKEWIPEGYEERIEGRGFLMEEWAPQLLILNHEAVGGFVTHCGWNSSLEGITAGLPMATWPLFAEQFFNERLLVDVLEIGVSVGSKVFEVSPENRPVVDAAALETAVRSVMGEGEEAEERRRRVRELKEMARKAVEEGGSSYNDLGNLIQELMEKKKARAV